MTELAIDGRRAISFTVSGEWAHFRRVDTTNDKQTYRVIPRTTAAGLVAAILGEPRDSYYDEFSKTFSAMAIVPAQPIRTMQVPMLTVPTTEADLGTAEGTSGKTIVKPSVLESKRQRRSFEYLRNPAYRIHLVLENDEWMDRLADRLDPRSPEEKPEEHNPKIRPVYTPSLGKTECLATIEDPVESTVSTTQADVVDSTVPETAVTPQTDVSYSLERTPAFMEAEEGGRKTTGFVSYIYPDDGGQLHLDGVDAAEVGEQTVVFF